MRLIDRTTHNTSQFSGQCMSAGYNNDRSGQFSSPNTVVIDKRDKNQLLITDYWNNAARTVDLMSQVVGTFVKSDIRGITQEEKSGDLYVTSHGAVYRIMYTQRSVLLISGSPRSPSYRDSTLLDSRFYSPYALIFITPHILLVADYVNNKLRLLDMNSDKVTTLNVINSLKKPYSLLLTNNSLYLGQRMKITQYKCEHNITVIRLKQ